MCVCVCVCMKENKKKSDTQQQKERERSARKPLISFVHKSSEQSRDVLRAHIHSTDTHLWRLISCNQRLLATCPLLPCSSSFSFVGRRCSGGGETRIVKHNLKKEKKEKTLTVQLRNKKKVEEKRNKEEDKEEEIGKERRLK